MARLCFFLMYLIDFDLLNLMVVLFFFSRPNSSEVMIIFREKFKKSLFHLCHFVHRVFLSVFMVYFDRLFPAESNGDLIFFFRPNRSKVILRNWGSNSVDFSTVTEKCLSWQKEQHFPSKVSPERHFYL